MKAVRLSTATLYRATAHRQVRLFLCALAILFLLVLVALSIGAYGIPVARVFGLTRGGADAHELIVIWNIRMPRIAASILSGWGLALAGLAMQSLLRNPLVSPFTLGISHGAAFGAAFSIVVLGAGVAQTGVLRTSASQLVSITNIAAVTTCAFLGAMATTATILLLSRVRRLTPQSVILAGIALSSLFVSGTILLQYFANEVELAAVVFWTFGDVARSNWQEIAVLAVVAVIATIVFLIRQWDLNTLAAGDDAAKALGVHVDRLRYEGMLLASLLAAFVTAFHGVIAFLGLLGPHIGKKLVGTNHRALLPVSCVVGAILLLAADTLGRCIVGSGTFPVGILTSFMGAPLFLYLLLKGDGR